MGERTEEVLERAGEHHAERLRERRLAPAHHPGPRVYIRVALILAVVTAIEVAIFYIDSFHSVLVPALLLLSTLKFSLVVLYFMHLRYDSRSFATMFMTGLSLALTVFVVVLLTFGVFSG